MSGQQVEIPKKQFEESWIDFVVFALITFLGVYCAFILIQVGYLLFHQSSIAEQSRYSRHDGFYLQHKKLTWKEWKTLVFGQPNFDLLCLFPTVDKN